MCDYLREEALHVSPLPTRAPLGQGWLQGPGPCLLVDGGSGPPGTGTTTDLLPSAFSPSPAAGIISVRTCSHAEATWPSRSSRLSPQHMLNWPRVRSVLRSGSRLIHNSSSPRGILMFYNVFHLLLHSICAATCVRSPGLPHQSPHTETYVVSRF